MQISMLKATVLIVACTLSVAAAAQKTYKCADSYSQLPCPGGVVVDTDDSRTSAQKVQSDLATRRDAKTADAMEKTRLAQEKRALAANAPTLKAASVKTPQKTVSKQASKKKRKGPEFFTAQAPGVKKKPMGSKKNALEKDAAKP